MRRVITWLMLPLVLLCLAGCGSRSGSVTPGNLETPTAGTYVPPSNSGAADVSADYRKELCTYPWLDTYTMQYYKLSEDGSFVHCQDEELEQRLEDGSWQLLKNDAGQLTLRMEVAGGEAFELYELELYDQSIYARGLNDFIYIWLLAGPDE